jgi:hypothetical protein
VFDFEKHFLHLLLYSKFLKRTIGKRFHEALDGQWKASVMLFVE